MPDQTSLNTYADTLRDAIQQSSFRGLDGASLSSSEGVSLIHREISRVQQNGKKLLFVGNGGSATVAGHFAEDFTKVAGVRGVCFNDGPLLTCLANDFSFEEVFQKAIEMYADTGDMLFAISSSGKSLNILNAVSAGKKKRCFVVTLSGFKEDNPLSHIGDVNIHTPVFSYGIVESAHSVILHAILDVFAGTFPLKN